MNPFGGLDYFLLLLLVLLPVVICGLKGKQLRVCGMLVCAVMLLAIFRTEGGLRGYRTGDLCRMEDGMLYYLGRLDGQIKLNGFRVELEDVENNLVKLPNIARAAVLPVLQDGRVTALTAFVLLEKPDGEGALQRARRIKAALADCLPS